MSKKFTSTVAGASILLTGVGLISKGLGLVREMVFAGSFGLSSQYDLFLVGTVIPVTINTIVLYIAQNYFIPLYNRFKQNESEAQSRAFIAKSLIIFSGFGFLIMTGILLTASGMIKFYLNNPDPAQIDSAARILSIYALTIPLNAAFSILSAYLYSEFDFKLPTIAQLTVNVSVIILVLLFADKSGVESIAIGFLIGTTLQLLFVAGYIFRDKKLIRIFNLRIKLFYQDSSLLIIVLIEALSQLYLISDRYFLTRVEEGGIAALNYSLNLFILPISIISVALSTALFPTFSKSFTENNLNQIKERLNKFFSLNLFIFLPMTFTFVFFGDIIIQLLFQRGAFNARDSLITFEALKYFSISLIFYSSYVVLNKLMYSLELIKQLLLITIIGCTLKVVLNFILVDGMKQDGLALSSSISYIFFFGTSLLMVRKKLLFSINRIFLQKLILLLINSFISYTISDIIAKNLIIFHTNVFVISCLQLSIFMTIYLLNSYFTQKHYLIDFIKMIRVNIS